MATFWNFPGKTLSWLETELGKVLDDQASGKTVVSSGAGDSSMSESVQVNLADRKRMILADLAALTAASLTTVPSTYVRNQVIGAKRTRPSFA